MPQTSPDTERDTLVEKIRGRFDAADKGVHKRFRDKAEHFYALYRNYTDFRDGQRGTDRRDRDLGLRYAQREWGAELFIPYSFSTVESILPRMLSNAPKSIVKPKDPESVATAPSMKSLIDCQFREMKYEVALQQVARNGLIYGLGVQKTYWASSKTTKKTLRAPTLPQPGGPQWVAAEKDQTNEDPCVLPVDPFDFFWDPFAGNICDCDWVIHRNWRSTEYCQRLVDRGVWKNVTKDEVTNGPGGASNYSAAWMKRMKVDGYPDFKAGDVHEVWEYHDGKQVVTVLDRQWVVQQGQNPAWHGELPFQVFRPTPVDGRMVGIGEIEPIVDLQAEINTLRSQRRDNATIVLQQSYFYSDGMIDPGDFKIGPGVGVPVLGDPREAVMPMKIGDIPNSGYTEEDRMKQDIQRTTGLDDSMAGNGQPQATATGSQLVLQSANLRIAMKTRLAQLELVGGAAKHICELNQQNVRAPRPVRQPVPTQDPSQPEQYDFQMIGPQEIQGSFEVTGDTMTGENIPQMRNDAQTWFQLAQNPAINPEAALREAVKNMGQEHPEAFITPKPQEPMVPQRIVDGMIQIAGSAGVDANLLHQSLNAAQQPPEKQ